MQLTYRRFLSHDTLTKRSSSPRLRHSLRFVSLIPPHSVAVHRKFESTNEPDLRNVWRLTFKKSYLILYWMNYLTSQTRGANSDRKVSLAILPKRRSVYTLTKAPMAHKTNSKEQYAFNFYNFVFTTTLTSCTPTETLNVIQMAHLLYLTKSLFPVFETNLLFLKYFNVEHSFADPNFLPKI